MVTRRKLILSGTAAVLAVTLPYPAFAADDPAGILTAIYTRVAKGKGMAAGERGRSCRRERGGGGKGDGGPVGFDPVTNSQDPDVKSFKVVAEKQEADKAVIAVTIDSHQGPPPKPADRIIRYEFVREPGGWKIDEIKGAVDGEAWSLRAIITDFLKY